MDISEIEKRLEVASHYRSLLNRPLFDKTNEATDQIQSEIRSFVQERLEVLLGMEPLPQTFGLTAFRTGLW